MHQLLHEFWIGAHIHTWIQRRFTNEFIYFPPAKTTRGVKDVPTGQMRSAPGYHQSSPTAAHLEKRKGQEFCQKKPPIPLKKTQSNTQKTPNSDLLTTNVVAKLAAEHERAGQVLQNPVETAWSPGNQVLKQAAFANR